MESVVYHDNDIIPDEVNKLYPFDITFYDNRPDVDFNLKQMEQFIEERIEVLMIIKNLKEKGYVYYLDEWNEHILEKLTTLELFDYIRLLYYPDQSNSNCTTCKWTDINRRLKDLAAHYMLVLICCRNPKKATALLILETDLFFFKYQHLTNNKIKEFIQTYPDLHTKLISNDEKNRYRKDLLNCTSKLTEDNFNDTDFYKVPITAALDLVGNVECFIRRGFMYVAHYQTVYIFKCIFERHLHERLRYFGQNMREFHDDRLLEIIDDANASSNKLMEEYKPFSPGQLTLSSIENHAQNSFPLCARNLYEAMHRFHHLKYFGRNQFQLFLKDAGLSVQDCLELFRREFTKINNGKVFDRDYGYYIRHNYGLVGSKIKFKALSCASIMDQQQYRRPRTFHGCPFLLFDSSLLQKRLTDCNGLNDEGIREICDIAAKAGHQQVACSKFFELTHNGLKIDIHHPNQFYEESRKYYLSKEQQEPQPSTSRQEPQPSTSRQEPQPSTSRQEPQPSTSQQEPQPSTSQQKPQPSTSTSK